MADERDDKQLNNKSEDRMFGGNIAYIDLTPRELWDGPIKKLLGVSRWYALENHIAFRAQRRCELCGAGKGIKGLMGKGANQFRVEMRFDYDDINRRATLRRLFHVCHSCSQAIHLRQTELQSIGMAVNRSPMIGALARLRYFSGGTKTDADLLAEMKTALDQWMRRDGYDFDFSVAVNLGKQIL